MPQAEVEFDLRPECTRQPSRRAAAPMTKSGLETSGRHAKRVTPTSMASMKSTVAKHANEMQKLNI